MSTTTKQPERQGHASSIIFKSLSAYEMKPVDWLWKGYIAKGVISIIHGWPEAGKGAITADMVAAFSNGGTLPDGTKAPKGRVLWFSSEDSPSYVLQGRIRAAGGDPEMVAIFEAVQQQQPNKPSKRRTSFDLETDLANLEKAIVASGDVVAVIFDPITSYISGDLKRKDTVRGALDPLTAMAERTKVAVILIGHDVKVTKDHDRAASLFSGSAAFWEIAQAMFVVEHSDPDNRDSERRFMPSKFKLPGGRPPSLGFVTEGACVGNVDTIRVKWQGQIDARAEDALRGDDHANDNKPTKLDHAKAFLRTVLANGPVPEKEVKRFAADEGIAGITLQRAKTALVESVYNQSQKATVWRLVDHPALRMIQ